MRIIVVTLLLVANAAANAQHQGWFDKSSDRSKTFGLLVHREKFDPSSVITSDEDLKFAQDEAKCIDAQSREFCEENVRRKRSALEQKRRAEMLRWLPPDLLLSPEEEAKRIALLPPWHPEKRRAIETMATLSSYMKGLVVGEAEAATATVLITNVNEADMANGKACLRREADAKNRKWAEEEVNRPITAKKVEAEKQREFRRMTLADGVSQVVDAKPRIAASSAFEDSGHKQMYRAQSEKFIINTQTMINHLQNVLKDSEADFIYRKWQMEKEALNACRDSKSWCK